ncbi:glucose dehydrogenase [FAD, quinone]-like [Pectinophora gossypiella]|uniref:glucose dehydrogenase [FAD, quinone]-like n=1 Tax=Pectinophora gossypiella TaxID=13191 RepID=UPI00214F0B4D|nr:glucose dehydrogenase [FAD, quinone]-like [Pectinophora gossypiella]
MRWQPPDLEADCPPETNITACEPFGFLFLNIVASLYGGSKDFRIQTGNEFLDYGGRIMLDIENYNHDKEVEGEEYNVIALEEYDFIVVGAGTAGCVVASRLSEITDWKVLLLEAGPEAPDVTLVPALSETMVGSSIDWRYQTEPDPRACLARKDRRCNWARGKVMGGTGSLNSMMYLRGHPVDFDDWAAAGNVGWSYEEVLPYFKKSERNLNKEANNHKYHNIHGPQPISRFPVIDLPSRLILDSLKELGLPVRDVTAGNFQYAAFQIQAFGQDGERASTYTAYIQSVRYKRKNLIIKPNSEVTSILIDDKKRAYGVRYIRNGKIYTAKVTKDVIVSAGTINSPKLLMLSGIGPKKHLEEVNIHVKQDLPVGENLQNHVGMSGLLIAFDNITSPLVSQSEMIALLREYKQMEVKRGPLSSTGIYNTHGFMKSHESLRAPDIQIQSYQVLLNDIMSDPEPFERLKIFPNSIYDAISIRAQNIAPKSRGCVLLNATNPNGPPLLYANYLADPKDIIPMQRGVQFLKNLESTQPFISGRARFVRFVYPACEDTDWGTDENTECMARHYTYVLGHQVGTCKMGIETDPTAVVDPRLRVYGIAGLRVIDNSIMPQVTRGNTNAPAVMIGEKGAAMAIEDWLHNYSSGNMGNVGKA